MNKRYAIIIEEKNEHVIQQSVEEVKTIDDILDIVLSYTNYFTPEEDGVSEELIDRKEFKELAKEIAFCSLYQEPQTTYGNRYCDILEDIKNINSIEDCYKIFPKLNELLNESNHDIEIFLNEREDDGCGWNGEE